MHPLAIGFWGAFFGAAGLMLLGSLAAFAQSHRRVALAAALSAAGPALYALALIGWPPFADATYRARALSHVGILIGMALAVMLMADLGVMRDRRRRRRIVAGTVIVAAVAVAFAWQLEPAAAVTFGMIVPLACTVAALPVAVLSALRGDRLAWFGAFALAALTVGLGGAFWIAHDRAGASWPMHALTAGAGIAYLAGIAGMLWLRYSYLIELREVLAQGPRYDPVTRMPSDAATGHMVVQAFQRQPQDRHATAALVAVAITNLAELERRHGRAMLNHVLFVCASRLRRCVPGAFAMGRLHDDGFLLVAPQRRDLAPLVRLARVVARSLSKPITLRGEHTGGEDGATPAWIPDVGVGVLAAPVQPGVAAAVAEALSVARAAAALPDRVASRGRDGAQPVTAPAQLEIA